MARLVHLAGPMIQVRSQCRQRCAWCGTTIQDIDLSNVMVATTNGEPRQAVAEDLPVWVGLVAVDRNRKYPVEEEVEPDTNANMIPTDSCMHMPNEETR